MNKQSAAKFNEALDLAALEKGFTRQAIAR